MDCLDHGGRRAFIPVLGCALALAAAIFTALPACAQADAQGLPKVIRLIVPFAAGGSTDVIGRLLAERLAPALGASVVVENRPGAGATLGADAVAKGPADGSMLVISSTSSIAPVPLMRAKMPYDPVKDFAHLAIIGTFANGLLLRGDSPIGSLDELLAQIRAQPDRFSFASVGVGSSGHLTGELLQNKGGLRLVHVPYKGASQAVVDLIGGRVDIQFESLVSAGPNIKNGKLKLIAVASPERSRLYPEVPAIAERVPGVIGAPWFGVSASAKVPAATLARLEAAIVGVLRDPETRKKLEELGMDPSGAGSAEFVARIHEENRVWGPIIEALGIRIQ
jgi:tripartite-type tricarboxylate transporter receptor subunit TctC